MQNASPGIFLCCFVWNGYFGSRHPRGPLLTSLRYGNWGCIFSVIRRIMLAWGQEFRCNRPGRVHAQHCHYEWCEFEQEPCLKWPSWYACELVASITPGFTGGPIICNLDFTKPLADWYWCWDFKDIIFITASDGTIHLSQKLTLHWRED